MPSNKKEVNSTVLRVSTWVAEKVKAYRDERWPTRPGSPRAVSLVYALETIIGEWEEMRKHANKKG